MRGVGHVEKSIFSGNMASIPAVTPHVDHLAGEHGLLARVDRRAGGLLCPPLVAPHQAGHHQRHQDPSQRHLTSRHAGPQYTILSLLLHISSDKCHPQESSAKYRHMCAEGGGRGTTGEGGGTKV